MAKIRIDCPKCAGEGGWRGWPGYVCYECGGRGTITVEQGSIERNAKARAKRLEQSRDEMEANMIKSEVVFAALHNYYRGNKGVQTRLGELGETYRDMFLIDYFRGEFTRQTRIFLPQSIPEMEPNIQSYLQVLDESYD